MRIFTKALGFLAMAALVAYAATVVIAPGIAKDMAVAGGQTIATHPIQFIGSACFVGLLVAFRAFIELAWATDRRR